MVPEDHPKGVPMGTYFATSSRKALEQMPFAGAANGCDSSARKMSAAVQLVLKRVAHLPFRPLPSPWWCENGPDKGRLCVYDWTPCDAKILKLNQRSERAQIPCPPYRTTPLSVMGRVISGAFDFLERECTNTVEIKMPRGATWYKAQQPIRVTYFPPFSSNVMTAAARLEQMLMGCSSKEPAKRQKVVAAMLRIAKAPAFRGPPEALGEACLTVTSALSQMSESVVPRAQQACPHFLATDWFVRADPGGNRNHAQKLNECLARLEWRAGSAAVGWVHITPKSVQLGRILDGLPEMQEAFRRDKAGFHSILELAMLAQADTCIELSHMAETIANFVRVQLHKPGCVHLRSKQKNKTAVHLQLQSSS